jgi:hypothetical protein
LGRQAAGARHDGKRQPDVVSGAAI